MLALVRCWCWCWSWCGVGVVDVDIFVGGGVVGGVGVDSGGTVGGNGVVAADVVGVWGLHPLAADQWYHNSISPPRLEGDSRSMIKVLRQASIVYPRPFPYAFFILPRHDCSLCLCRSCYLCGRRKSRYVSCSCTFLSAWARALGKRLALATRCSAAIVLQHVLFFFGGVGFGAGLVLVMLYVVVLVVLVVMLVVVVLGVNLGGADGVCCCGVVVMFMVVVLVVVVVFVVG